MNHQIGIMRKLRSRTAAVSTSFVLALGCWFMPAAAINADAATFSDINDHWAKVYIEKAVEKNIVNGYGDGTFRPDASVTRAEFITMFNNALGLTYTSDSVFADVSRDSWYYDNVCKAVSAGYISGYVDGTFAPDKVVSRQEAAVMLARIVPTRGYSKDLTVYLDGASVPDWSREPVSRIVAKGYLGTLGDDCIHMGDRMTRAQAVKIIISVLDNERIMSDNKQVIKDTTVSNIVFTNRITVNEDVLDGKVNFTDCVILGQLNIKGGGSGNNGVYLENTRVSNCVINREDNAVAVHAIGETTIMNTDIKGETEIDSISVTGDDYGMGFVNVTVLRAADIADKGNISIMNIEGEKGDIHLIRGTIGTLNVFNGAYKTDIVLDAGTVIETANVYADGTEFSGDGTIEVLNRNAKDIVVNGDTGTEIQ